MGSGALWVQPCGEVGAAGCLGPLRLLTLISTGAVTLGVRAVPASPNGVSCASVTWHRAIAGLAFGSEVLQFKELLC